MRYALLSVAVLALATTGSSTGHSSSIGSRANAEQLKTGRFLYRTFVNGKDAGTSEISISKLGPDRFMFTNRISGAFAQQWEAVATAMFAPVSAKLAFGEGDKLRSRFELNYREGRATGWRLEKSTDNKIDIDVRVLPDTVDQRIDWAAAMAQELVPGHEFSFSVFDPVTQISRVTGRVVGPETVNVPAGTFAAIRIAYSIEKPDGKETYQVLTNATGARVLLKEEFPNRAIVELVRFDKQEANR
jgi:Protein of unknown function (DUF3108)